jgi:magnesium transporter
MTMQYAIELKTRLLEAIQKGNAHLAVFLRETLPADLAELAEHLNPEERVSLIRALSDEQAAEVLGELDPAISQAILKALGKEKAGDIIEAMATDDAADLLAELEPAHQGEILGELTAEDATEVRDLLRYDPETAGGRMTTDLVTVHADMTADQVIALLRREAPDAESVYYLYVTEGEDRLVGVLSLRELIIADPKTPVRQMMRPKVKTVRPEASEEEVARVVAKYNLLAVPVVSESGQLLGMVTHDDVLDMVEKIRAAELLRVVGSDAEELERKNPAQIARARLPWLLGTMLIELLAGTVIHRFDETLSHMILLASFMPIISAISGNVGLQSATIVVRGLGTGIYSPHRWAAPLWRELKVDVLMGLALGLVLAVIGGIWSGKLGFGLVVGISLMASMLTAGFMGTVIPLFSKRLGFDPAVTAGPFETAFQDVIGFGVFLGLATALMPLLV